MKNYRALLAAAFAALLASTLVMQAQVPGVNSTLSTIFTLAYDQSTMKPTYSASTIVVPAAAATDVCVLTGSATKNVRVRRVILAGLASAAFNAPVIFIKRSTVPVGGTSTLTTKVPYDSTNSLTPAVANAATAVAEAFTANPTVGTPVGILAELWLGLGNLTTGIAIPINYSFGDLGSPVVLRGAAQTLSVNLNGATYTTPQLSCTFEWTEE